MHALLTAQVFMERQYNTHALCRMERNYIAALSNVLFKDNSCHFAGALAIKGVAHTIGPNAAFVEGGSIRRRTLPPI